MTEAERRNPTCGALLVDERRMSDAATGRAIPVWQCEKQHGWLPIDPGAKVEEEPTTTLEDE